MSPSAKILSASSAVPGNLIDQREAVELAGRLFGKRFKDFERLSAVFGTSGIRQRQAVMPLEWYAEPRGWPERTAAYLEGGGRLFVEAARRALDEAGLLAS